MLDKCPGQNKQFWGPDDVCEVACSNCGYLVELFKDELKRKCPKCNKEIINPKMDLGCAMWCPKAKDCIGPERYSYITKTVEMENRRKKDFDRFILTIDKKDEDVKKLFTRLYIENKNPKKIFDTKKLYDIKETNPDLFERATRYYSNFRAE
ncbi:MAG: hypothetical protein FJZ16_03890 [Candidatus Omnitrophica bacterium]|nr:hypothetical protein [Candidatus Omnitrophota bacterium]